ncbi:transcriptional regulator [Aeromonas hydrophila NJ-35]|uniref:flagellar transcriptional regulator FlhD n=1 Tax=Aeromonas TaxID=642 RepID=UPI0006556DFA|nr:MULTISPECIES: flagellar transcriptional regulator FlhD [Aeromonas]AKJ36905.1 transcriptional regulator [Aeromonas hydrophila NJ-35]ALZ82613.1 transcriptional regulator [Aeromonas hydrophila]QGW99165.1 transcriptional regulator [Aeromonas veronii]HDK8695685.1 flagellar transcriptional regulator FlhD [Aeromonas hydrophila]
MELDIISTLDMRSLTMEDETADPNVFEFDYTLWNLLSTLSREHPDIAASQFSLNMSTVRKLATATPEQLKALSSGVCLSFQLRTSECSILNILRERYDPTITIRRSLEEFDVAYWLLVNRMALRDLEIAREIFGISYELASAIAQATDSQLRQMAATTVTRIGLRCSPSVIEEILEEGREDITHSLLKKIQQSLGQGGLR